VLPLPYCNLVTQDQLPEAAPVLEKVRHAFGSVPNLVACNE
jgi:hypothetical protein